MIIEKSKDYDKFRYFEYNRNVNTKKVDKICDSIKNFGAYRILIVTPQFYILDGQHYFQAMKKLKREIYYTITIIEPVHYPELIATLNTTATKWADNDYLNMWATLGISDYQYIINLIERNNISLTIFLTLHGQTKTFKIAFFNGKIKFTIEKKRFLDLRISRLIEIRQLMYSKKMNINAISSAISRVIISPQYNHDRMIEKLNNYAGSIKPARSITDYIYQLQEIYNHGLHEQKRIDFCKR